MSANTLAPIGRIGAASRPRDACGIPRPLAIDPTRRPDDRCRNCPNLPGHSTAARFAAGHRLGSSGSATSSSTLPSRAALIGRGGRSSRSVPPLVLGGVAMPRARHPIGLAVRDSRLVRHMLRAPRCLCRCSRFRSARGAYLFSSLSPAPACLAVFVLTGRADCVGHDRAALSTPPCRQPRNLHGQEQRSNTGRAQYFPASAFNAISTSRRMVSAREGMRGWRARHASIRRSWSSLKITVSRRAFMRRHYKAAKPRQAVLLTQR